MNHRVLKINKSGLPVQWITKQQAAHLICSDKVLWSFGENRFEIKGGINRSGKRSVIRLDPIIAVAGVIKSQKVRIPLTNRALFRRDNMCMYCGSDSTYNMTRDHIIPKSQGGRDSWVNVVQACYTCNQRKRNRTPEEANMPLLAVPFEPTFHELLYLQNKHILNDQLAFLEKGFKHVSVCAA
jgi:5-methylcytosine-specific restriction endonuclease McrA